VRPPVRYIAVFFLIISSIFVVPKELLHELTFHEDTHDVCYDAGNGPAVDIEHHHCDVLQLYMPPCTSPDAAIVFSEFIQCADKSTCPFADETHHFPESLLNRGPPSPSFSC
jgi:hypothetical protein